MTVRIASSLGPIRGQSQLKPQLEGANHTDYDVDALAMCSRRFLDTRGIARRSATVDRL